MTDLLRLEKGEKSNYTHFCTCFFKQVWIKAEGTKIQGFWRGQHSAKQIVKYFWKKCFQNLLMRVINGLF